jgi:hypothetical protein
MNADLEQLGCCRGLPGHRIAPKVRRGKRGPHLYITGIACPRFSWDQTSIGRWIGLPPPRLQRICAVLNSLCRLYRRSTLTATTAGGAPHCAFTSTANLALGCVRWTSGCDRRASGWDLETRNRCWLALFKSQPSSADWNVWKVASAQSASNQSARIPRKAMIFNTKHQQS